MGFYYNEQLKRISTRVTLHPNTEYDPPKKDDSGHKVESEVYDKNNKLKRSNDWVAISDPERCFKDSSTLGTMRSTEDNYVYKYRKKPIATAIINEDFQIDVQNAWSSGGGGGIIEDLFNRSKGIAPFANKISKMSDIIKQTEGYENSWKSLLVDLANKGSDILKGAAENIEKFANRKLVTQGTKFSYYNGTNVNFTGLQMKFTLFADWVETLDNNGFGTGIFQFKTVYEQIKELQSYAQCTLKRFDVDELSKTAGGWLDSLSEKAKEVNKEKSDFKPVDVKKEIENFFHWQLPPGGYFANMDSTDFIQFGTLRLEIGNNFSLENLVIKDFNVTYSKVNCKNPLKELEVTPLYADVVILLQPVSIYTLENIERAITSRTIKKTEVDEEYFKEKQKEYKEEKDKFDKKLILDESKWAKDMIKAFDEYSEKVERDERFRDQDNKIFNAIAQQQKEQDPNYIDPSLDPDSYEYRIMAEEINRKKDTEKWEREKKLEKEFEEINTSIDNVLKSDLYEKANPFSIQKQSYYEKVWNGTPEEKNTLDNLVLSQNEEADGIYDRTILNMQREEQEKQKIEAQKRAKWEKEEEALLNGSHYNQG